MIKHPSVLKQNVINIAIRVNKCISEFGSSTEKDISYCSEPFEELSKAVYELERFTDDVFLIRQKLEFIVNHTKEYGQPTRNYMVEVEIGMIKTILDRWEVTG